MWRSFSSFGAELACHYEWKPPTQLITVLRLHLDYLTLLMQMNLWKKRVGHQLAVSWQESHDVTDAMLGPSLSLADGETSGKRLSGLADLRAEAQSRCELQQQGANVCFSPLPGPGSSGCPWERVWRKLSYTPGTYLKGWMLGEHLSKAILACCCSKQAT